MISTAVLKGARLSPQKARLVADHIRGLPVSQALNFLEFSTKKAAVVINKLVRSAIANAENNHQMDIDELYVHRIFVDKGMFLKRMMPRAKGRSNRILKPTAHITVQLKQHNDQ